MNFYGNFVDQVVNTMVRLHQRTYSLVTSILSTIAKKIENSTTGTRNPVVLRDLNLEFSHPTANYDLDPRHLQKAIDHRE